MTGKLFNTNDCTILITECDTVPGFYTARQVLASKKWGEVVCAVSDKHDELSKMLEKEGGNLVDWDWESVEEMVSVLKECDALILAQPRDFDALSQVENLMTALKKSKSPALLPTHKRGDSTEGVKSMALLSFITAEFAEEGSSQRRRSMNANKMAELYSSVECLVQEYCSSIPILRVGAPIQTMFYLSEVIQNKGVLPLSTGEGEFAPVDFKDVGMAANNVVIEILEHHHSGGNDMNLSSTSCKNRFVADGSNTYQQLPQHHKGGRHPHHGRVYTLTGNRLVTGESLAKIASSALEAEIEFDDVDSEEMKSILSQTGELSSFDIEDILAGLCLIKEDKIDFVTRDLHKLIGKKPSDVATFFRDNARQFKPKRRFAPTANFY